MTQDEPSSHQRADELASRQNGAISRKQALKAGLTRHQIDRQLALGRWRIATRGVYVLAGSPDNWRRSAMVAILAAPSGALLSHLTAAALFDLAKPPPLPHITVDRSASARFGQAIVHRSSVALTDRCMLGKLPCTRPARTIVDCAALLTQAEVNEMADAALCRRLTTPEALRAVMAQAGRAPGRKGIPLLDEALSVWAPGPIPGSPAEMRLLRRLVEWGFPLPERQIEIRDEQGRFVARIDLGWSAHRVGCEYYGEAFHGPRRWAHDDHRQGRIEALGWRVVTVDRFDLRPSSTRLRDLLAMLLPAAA